MAKQNVNQVKISDEDLAKIQKAVEDSRPKGYFENLKEQQISPKEAMEFVKENPEVLKLLVLKKGGKVTDENYDMLRGKIKEVKHHASELQSITNRKKQVPAWVLAKSTRASTDLSDITHYMDSQKFSGGGGVPKYKVAGREVTIDKKGTNDQTKWKVTFINNGKTADYLDVLALITPRPKFSGGGGVDGIEGVNRYLGLFKLNSNFRGDLVYWKKGEIVKAYESNKKGIIFVLLADDNFQAYDEWEKSDFERIASPLLTNGGGVGNNFEKELDEKLESEGWKINYYNNNIDEVKKEEATQMSVFRFEPYYESYSIKIPKKKEVTFAWIMDKVSKDNVYKSFSENFNSVLESLVYNGLNVYPTTYGIGVSVIFGNKNESKYKIEKVLNDYGIDYTTEYSDAFYVFRYKISKSAENIKKLEKIKYADGGGVESTSHIQGEIDDIRNWDNDEIANYIGVPISYVARDRNRYVREAQNYMMLNTFETGGNIGFKELSSRVSKSYQGKAVSPKYQSQYGKKYSKSEAREVGDKVAGKVYREQQARKFDSGGGVEKMSEDDDLWVLAVPQYEYTPDGSALGMYIDPNVYNPSTRSNMIYYVLHIAPQSELDRSLVRNYRSALSTKFEFVKRFGYKEFGAEQYNGGGGVGEVYALSNQELTKKSSITNISIQDIYNMISDIDDIDSIQEIGIIISRKDWSNRMQFPVKQKIYREIQKIINEKQVIKDLRFLMKTLIHRTMVTKNKTEKKSKGGGVDDLKVGDKVVEYTKDSKFESGYFEGKVTGLILQIDGAMAEIDFGKSQIYWIPLKDLKKVNKFDNGGGVEGVEWDKDSDSIRTELGEFKIMITPQMERGYYDVSVSANNKIIGKEYDVYGLDKAKDLGLEMIGNANKYNNGGSIKENRSGLSDLMYG